MSHMAKGVLPRVHRSYIQLKYSPLETDQLSELANTHFGDGEKGLFVNDAESRPQQQIVLQSATSSTKAYVQRDNATLVTKYFGPEYTAMSKRTPREAYAEAKICALMRYLSSHIDSYKYIGVSMEARISVDYVEKSLLRKSAMSAFGFGGPLANNVEEIFDFEVRVSTVCDKDFFSNIKVLWYEEQSLQVVLQSSGSTIVQGSTLEDEGVLFCYDRNNKLGIRNGRSSWGESEAINAYTSIVNGFSGAIMPVYEKLADTFPRESV